MDPRYKPVIWYCEALGGWTASLWFKAKYLLQSIYSQYFFIILFARTSGLEPKLMTSKDIVLTNYTKSLQKEQ